jgi:acyl-CoA thioesterase II
MGPVPQSIHELVALLDLETIEEGLYRGRQPETALQRVFGGQVAGQALVAATRTVAEERAVHSLHAYFLRPGDTSVPIVYDVERTRDGRSFSTRRMVARQHGRPIFYMSASFQVAETGLEHQDAMPAAPAPEDCPELGDLLATLSGRSRDEWDREWSALQVRYAGDSRSGGTLHDPEHPAISRVWLRASGRLGDDPSLHAAVLTYASDLTLLSASVIPHGTYIGDPRLQPASLDHAMWFHREFRADDWLLYDQVSPSASGGRGLATGRLFAADGRLVASVVQEGLVRFRQ